METSRKRYSENDCTGNRRKSRKSRKSKTKRTEEEIVNDEEMVNAEVDRNDVIALIETCSLPYSEEDDIKIINYFKGNVNMLNMRDDLSVYHIMKSKYAFQKSAKSLQSRFVNVILPNLYKYKVMNHSDLIDFYDAAKLELPEEFIKILDEEESANKKSKNTVQKEMINASCASRLNEQETTNKKRKSTFTEEENIGVPSTSRQSDVASSQSNTLQKKCLKSVLGFIQFNNSMGTCIFIPDTETNIASIEKRLFDEFGIQQDSIKIVPKIMFDLIKRSTEVLYTHNALMTDIFKNNSLYDTQFSERMLRDARNFERKFLDFCQANQILRESTEGQPSCEQPNELLNDNQFQMNNKTTPTANKRPIDATNVLDELEMDDVGHMITSLTDSFDQVSISPNIDNQEHDLLFKNFDQIKTEPVDEDDVETVIRSPYFVDHTYCKNNNKDVSNTEAVSSSNNITSNECAKDFLENNAMNMELNSPESSLIENACVPQIMFSKRCRDKITNEHINVDHLMLNVSPNDDGTREVDTFGKNDSNYTEVCRTNN